jgi:hypothetical protein
MKKNKTKETIKQAIRDMVKELNLKQYPTVKIIDTDEGYVMAAGGSTFLRSNGFFNFNQTITHTECDYILRINKKAVNKAVKDYTLMFGSKKAAYDFIYLITCHELRHMWQYESDFFVGRPYRENNFTELFEGHGSSPEEIDANEFMIEMANRKGLGRLGRYMELSQRADGLSNRLDSEFQKTCRSAYVEAVNDYNKLLGLFIK